MKTNVIVISSMSAVANPAWTTASFGGAPDTSPMELSALGAHLDSCRPVHGRLVALRCVAKVMNGFVTARFVTTLVVATLLIAVGSLIF